MSDLLSNLLNLTDRPKWFQVKTGHDEFLVNRDRVGGIRRYHIPGNLHTISILWTNGDPLVIYQGMSDTDAETVWQSLRSELVIDATDA